jgi:shikimate dehydrogenase
VTTARADHRPADCDIAVNATSLGLRADDPLPFAVDALPATATVAEVVMNPLLTPLLLRAQARGLRIVKGDAMLKCQLAAWTAFLGFDTTRAHKESNA